MDEAEVKIFIDEDSESFKLDGEREYSLLGGGEAPSSSLILRSYSQCGVRADAFALLKMLAKSWYSSGTAERSGLSLAKAA